jgi:hypothetical protein
MWLHTILILGKEAKLPAPCAGELHCALLKAADLAKEKV